MTKFSSYILIFCLLGLYSIICHGATDHLGHIDSLKKELEFDQIDSTTAEIYLGLCYHFYAVEEMDSSCIYGLKGLEVENLSKYPFLKAQLLEQTAIAYEFLDVDKAIETYLLALEAFKVAGLSKYVNEEDLGGVSNAHISLIMMYAKKGDMGKAMEHYLLADNLMSEENPGTKAYLYEVMSYVQSTRKRFDVALEYEFKALEYYRKANSPNGVHLKLSEIGRLYSEMMNYDSSLHFLQLALEASFEDVRDRSKVELLNNLGKVNLELSNIDEAIKFYQEAEEVGLQLNNPNQLSLINAGLAIGYEQLGELTKAIEYGEKARQFAQETNDLVAQQTALEGLQKVYRKNDDYKKASLTLVTLLQLRDTLQNQNNRKLQEELVQQYEAREKQSQIDLQQLHISRQQIRLITAVIIALLLLALSLLSWRNIQQRKRTNSQLKELDQTKSRFFANISHELRTPLTLISAPLEEVLNSLKGQAHREELNLAHTNSKKLQGLIDEIMDLSKLEAGKLELIESDVHLVSLLKRIFFSYHSMAELKKLEMLFDYQLDEDLCVRLDVGKIEKVLNNLLSNALKYSEPGGFMELKIQSIPVSKSKSNKKNYSKGDCLNLTVSDSGPGIPESEIDYVFDRYYQGKQPGEPLQGGTGIGLALAKELTELLGGNLTVKSNVDDISEIGMRGSSFTITLPLIEVSSNLKIEKQESRDDNIEIQGALEDEDSGVLYSSKSKGRALKNSNNYQPTILNKHKPHILIVEDNREMSDFLFRTLSPLYRCGLAMDGEEAINLLQNESYDLITSDIMMPRLDGFAFLEKLNGIEEQRHTPVILLTARSLESDKLKGLRLGVDDYITKPFSTAELVARINNLLKNKFKREEWYSQVGTNEEPMQPLSVNQKALVKAEKIVEANFRRSSFKVGELAREMAVSERQLRRVLRKLTGLSPVDFISEMRLQAAYQMLERRQYTTVSEVCYEVGFERLSYFSWKFSERFGRNPSEMIN